MSNTKRATGPAGEPRLHKGHTDVSPWQAADYVSRHTEIATECVGFKAVGRRCPCGLTTVVVCSICTNALAAAAHGARCVHLEELEVGIYSF